MPGFGALIYDSVSVIHEWVGDLFTNAQLGKKNDTSPTCVTCTPTSSPWGRSWTWSSCQDQFDGG